jgi:hypothetical protein
MTLSLDEIPPLSVESRSAAKALTRARGSADRPGTNRREFISAVAAGGVALGGAFIFSVGRADRAAAAPPPEYSELKPGLNSDPCKAGNGGPAVSAGWYASNPPEKPCGPSPICNGLTFLGGCADGPWHRYYWPGGDDAWKYRPDQCPPGTSYDRWKWFRANYAGCGQAIINCHDGWKVVDGTPHETIRAGFVACA